MGIQLYKTDRVDSGECINCFKCVAACPRRNVRANPTPAVATALASAAIAGMYYAGTLTSETVSDSAAMSVFDVVPSSTVAVSAAATASESHSDAVLAAASAAATALRPPPPTASAGVTGLNAISGTSGQYADGVYTGSGIGFRGTIKVSVTVSGGKITAVQVVSSQDDTMYMSRAKSTIISSILSRQSVNVSTVSGATFSSNGILEGRRKSPVGRIHEPKRHPAAPQIVSSRSRQSPCSIRLQGASICRERALRALPTKKSLAGCDGRQNSAETYLLSGPGGGRPPPKPPKAPAMLPMTIIVNAGTTIPVTAWALLSPVRECCPACRCPEVGVGTYPGRTDERLFAFKNNFYTLDRAEMGRGSPARRRISRRSA